MVFARRSGATSPHSSCASCFECRPRSASAFRGLARWFIVMLKSWDGRCRFWLRHNTPFIVGEAARPLGSQEYNIRPGSGDIPLQFPPHSGTSRAPANEAYMPLADTLQRSTIGSADATVPKADPADRSENESHRGRRARIP